MYAYIYIYVNILYLFYNNILFALQHILYNIEYIFILYIIYVIYMVYIYISSLTLEYLSSYYSFSPHFSTTCLKKVVCVHSLHFLISLN